MVLRPALRRVLPCVLALVAAMSTAGPAAARLRQAPPPSPLFTGTAMWIWQVAKSSDGTVPGIVAQARAAHVTTIVVKAADADRPFGAQFSPQLITALHAAGISVCGYQFVYGRNPPGETTEAIAVARSGADCLVIDAEGQYEGRYGAAQRYMSGVRAAVGPDYPIALAPFPYVDYHPRFPYSVFLGPGGAQINLPQVYWRDIGTSVDVALSHTWTHNRIYGRPIFPIGQTYQNPPGAQIQRFRRLAVAYGATGVSWWSWQETGPHEFGLIGAPPPPSRAPLYPTDSWPLLKSGSKGDEVIWLQQHLATAAPGLPIVGTFGPDTARALRAYQAAQLLPVTGQTDAATWQALLKLDVTPVNWIARAHAKSTTARGAAAARRERREYSPRGR